MDIQPCYYHDYLKLDEVLHAQSPLSASYGEEAHDETLFIITHQTYELWFKQVLHELKDLQVMFSQDTVQEGQMGKALSRLERINTIFQLLIHQIQVIETMAPEDFLDFRHYLVPASGFQSIQFREIEVRLGLLDEKRTPYEQQHFSLRLSKEHREHLQKVQKETSLFSGIESWLERVPNLEGPDFSFWQEYSKAVEKMLQRERHMIEGNQEINDGAKLEQLKMHEITSQSFRTLLSSSLHEEQRQKGQRRLSHRATTAALFIRLYRDLPLLAPGARLLQGLITLDETLTTWRYRHSLLAHRMLGTKVGTGGSSGHHYLRATAQTHRIFLDLMNLSTFLIPKSDLPILSEQALKHFDFA